MKLFVRPLLLSILLCTTAQAATLEQLFEDGRYGDFLPKAQEAAAAQNTDALFLLGKAYHQGLGVAEDHERARELYEKARKLGSARASHGLANLLQHSDPHLAMSLYEEALARGLKMPTLYDLGLLTSPPLPGHPTAIPDFVTRSGQAGDYFARAYAESGDDHILLHAARQYLQALQFSRIALLSDARKMDPTVLRARAVEWLEKGKARGLGEAWSQYGIYLMEERDFVGARAALLAAMEKGDAEAHYQFAEMARKGLGGDRLDAVELLHHYERAALSGITAAVHPAREAILATLHHEEDEQVLEQGVQRILALGGQYADFPFALKTLMSRLEWSKTLRRQLSMAGPLPDLPLLLQACELGFNDLLGEAYNLGEYTDWRLAAYHAQQDQPLHLLEGRIDLDGCARSSEPLSVAVRQLLEQGAILALKFPNYSLPLTMKESEGQIILELREGAMPIPCCLSTPFFM